MSPSAFPGTPRLLKGALVVFDAKVPVPTNIIAFQYNPETLTRTFDQEAPDEDPRRGAGNTDQVIGPPLESFGLSVELDAADQLEVSEPLTVELGLHPALAALELLLYPGSGIQLLNRAMAKLGRPDITPAALPFVLLVWGRARVVPVRVTSVSITEQAFDQHLNPILAQVELGLRALSDTELAQVGAPWDTLGLVRQIGKEVIARRGAAEAVTEIRGLLPF